MAINPTNWKGMRELASAVIKKAKKDNDAEFFESEDAEFWGTIAYGKTDFRGFESVARQCREDREIKLLKAALKAEGENNG